jgi:hypothetical protein
MIPTPLARSIVVSSPWHYPSAHSPPRQLRPSVYWSWCGSVTAIVPACRLYYTRHLKEAGPILHIQLQATQLVHAALLNVCSCSSKPLPGLQLAQSTLISTPQSGAQSAPIVYDSFKNTNTHSQNVPQLLPTPGDKQRRPRMSWGTESLHIQILYIPQVLASSISRIIHITTAPSHQCTSRQCLWTFRWQHAATGAPALQQARHLRPPRSTTEATTAIPWSPLCGAQRPVIGAQRPQKWRAPRMIAQTWPA